MLSHFFAVTTTSVYVVKGGENSSLPSVRKIALKGRSSVSVGEELEAGTMVLVGLRIILFTPKKVIDSPLDMEKEAMNPENWSGRTSSVVALFLAEDDALDCHNSNDLEPNDSRWSKDTEAVIEAIGDGHTKFFICRDQTLSLIS